jgi:hypothetical protein
VRAFIFQCVSIDILKKKKKKKKKGPDIHPRIYLNHDRRFTAPGVPLLAPPIRQFSELPAWLDAHEQEEEGGEDAGELPRLKGRRIAMYCTGGVRCEVRERWG